MEQHDFLQGSPEWHAYRATHFNASDAPAMLGISPYKTRSQLLDELVSGILPEHDESTQQRFAEGHRSEALARPLAEKIIGSNLYPVVGSKGKYSASFDGLTMDETTCFEHKSLNADIKAALVDQEVPEAYAAQMEQQLMVSGATKCLFMATKWKGDDLVDVEHAWYESNPEMRARLIAGWEQFEKDMTTHKPSVTVEMPKAEVVIELPALFIHAQGEITDSNMKAYGAALTAKLSEVRAIQLVTDQDFSNAKAAAKLFREQCKKIELTKESMLSQTVSLGEAVRMMDAWHEDLRVTALKLEKDVEREDLTKKRAMVAEAGLAFTSYVEALESETRPIQLLIVRPDFAAVIKGKSKYASMQDAIYTALANSKIAADTVAKDVRTKLDWCKNNAAGMSFLFPDLQQIITKPMEDFTLTITSRIDKHKAEEAEKAAALIAKIDAENAAKMEAEREAIRIQEEAKARAKVEAEAVEAKRKEEIVKHVTQSEPVAPVASLVEKAQAISGTGTLHNPRPTRMAIIEVIAKHYSVSVLTADEWLRGEFGQMAA